MPFESLCVPQRDCREGEVDWAKMTEQSETAFSTSTSHQNLKMGGELIFIVLFLAIGLGTATFVFTPKGNNQT